MSKVKYIEAKYEAFLGWNLDELGIDYNDIEDFQIQNTSLVVEFKDGTTKEYDNSEGAVVDHRHGFVKVDTRDKDWNVIEEQA